jgi:hypothetical protein
VRQVDPGHHDRHIVLVAERRGRAQHGSRLGVLRLKDAGHIRLDRAEHGVDAGEVQLRGVFDRQLQHRGRRLLRAPPAPRAGIRVADGGRVRLARRAFGRRQHDQFEPWVSIQRHQALLSSDAGGAHDCNTLLHGLRCPFGSPYNQNERLISNSGTPKIHDRRFLGRPPSAARSAPPRIERAARLD